VRSGTLQQSVKSDRSARVRPVTYSDGAPSGVGGRHDRLRRAVSVPESLTPAEHRRPSLALRGGLMALALFAEKSALDHFVNFPRANTAQGLGAALRVLQHYGLRLATSFAIALAVLIWVRSDARLTAVNEEARAQRLRLSWLVVHGTLLVAMAACLQGLYAGRAPTAPFAVLGSALLALTGACVAALALAFAPWALCKRAATAIGRRWIYAAAAAVIGTGAIAWSQRLWAPSAQLTFELVRLVLAPLVPRLQADPVTRILRAPHFAVEVSSLCSGLEGVGLMLVFAAVWLLYFRREYRFPRALLLVPAGVLLIFALNVARIAALVLIGNAGYPSIAVFGFHSQAGWIAFNGAACAIAFVSLRSPWLSHAPPSDIRGTTPADNPTAAYLMPVLAVLAAGMLSRAVSSGFEVGYALRLVAAAIALAAYRSRLAALDWRFSWRGIGAGVGVFVLWIVASRFLLTPQGMPDQLAAMSAMGRDLWVVGRAATAIVAAPIVEELAYRGYLMRRLMATDFERVPFQSVGWRPLLVTALAFGALHGSMWLPAVAAGLVYGLITIRTGRMGEAVAAHLATNALLVVCVLGGGWWQLW
jgi:exosortase E/protease (VPEID-CTERM system)